MASVKKKKVFTQKQPPLSVAIRRILARYPDGQILKELLQNAEDAGASELRLILDLRQFDEEKLYDERLSVCQGPALLAYNDAEFTEDDWENIQKTEHSNKQMDPKKIGRFGIGFNSIYHLTDFPWIMSGSTIGVFDPCERGIFRDPIKNHSVGGYRWDLTDDDDEICEMSDQFAPFKYDNFDPEIHAHFNGTLFRFPLRQMFVQPDDPDMMLSKVTYTPPKIRELFKSFETDGDRLLLFLTSVHEVSLWQRDDDNPLQLYSVIKDVQYPSTIPKPLENIGTLCYYEAVIRVMQMNNRLTDTKKGVWPRWAIMQVIAKNFSESELNLLPWVGVACPLDAENIKTDGYISCFLPLPPDNESRTGLPMQVHGYFCLSDSRRSVLWPSAAMQNDPRPKWNETLANQLIPRVYAYLLEIIKKRNSDSDSYALISRLWPLQPQVNPDWNNFMVAFYKETVDKKLFWSSVTNKWVTVSDAVFLDQSLRESVRIAINKICSAAKKSVVSVSTHVPNHFQDIARTSVTHISPKYICGLFKQYPSLVETQYDLKKLLLSYVLSDSNCSSYLMDVPLLPLADGSYVSFHPNSKPIYVSSAEHPRSLLPGLDSMFLSDEYSMSNVLASGLTQLRKLQPNDIPKLIVLSIRNGYWKPEKELENLWQYINQHYNPGTDLTKWEGLSLIPVLSNNQTCTTCCIDSAAPVLSSDGIDTDVCQWLHNAFGLNLALPLSYLKRWLGSKYILNPQIPGSTLRIISQVWRSQPDRVVSAIQNAYLDSHSCFLWLQDQILISCALPFNKSLCTFLSALPLFFPVKGTLTGECLVSANEAKLCYFRDIRFEIEKLLCRTGFPFPLISSDSNFTLIRKLKLKEMTMAQFASILSININVGGYFSKNQEIIEVVSWLVTYYEELKRASVAFDELNKNVVLEQFKREISFKIHINNQTKYANFCSIFLSTSAIILAKIHKLYMIPCINNHLHCLAELVMSCGFKNTCPYICEPVNWVKEKCKTFLSCCSIRKTLSFDDMINIVRTIQKDHRANQKPLEEKTTLKGFLEVIDEIAKLSKKFDQVDIHKLKMPLPDSKGYLQAVDDKLLYNDLSATDQSGYRVVHKAVPRHIALHFGAKTLRDVLLERYEDNEEFGEEFGQVVDLVARIRRLLEQYHTQSDLFQEYLQNADDAGATKIAFLFDRRCHPVKGLLSEQYKELQSSAILIYNNSTFSDDDFRGIQQLGVGSKADDPNKIGRFGAGFNCAYRYTDCPSFISDDDVLCIFDPMQQFLNKSKKCGRKYYLSCQDGQSDDFRCEFSAVYNTYRINGFPLKGGTMFRLPLRKVERKLSLDKVLDNPESEIYILFNNVAPKMKEMMLFLRNVREVSAYQSDNHGIFKQMWHFQSQTSDSTWMTKEEFGLIVQESAKCSPSQITVARSSYELILKQTNKLHEEKWLVCQRLGFDKPPVSLDFSKVKLLPMAGVATRLDNADHKHSLFCSLPLPQKTEIPVSINGHFSLDSEGRKNLFTAFEGERDIRHHWNTTLLSDVASNAYLDLLEVLKLKINYCKYFSNDNPIEKIMKFWTFLPIRKQLKSDLAWSGTRSFSNYFFKMFASSERHLFPCLTKSDGTSSIDWLNLKGDKTGPLCPSDASFHLSPHGSQLKNAFILLHELGIKIAPCPKFILKAFSEASVPISTARPTTVASYLREPWINLIKGNRKLPCSLADSTFQSEKNVSSLLQFLMQPDETEFQLSDLDGLPLLITCDKSLRYFSCKNPAKLEEDEIVELFSEQTGQFVCKELRSTLRAYLNGHSDATVTALNLQDLHIMLPGEILHQGIQLQGELPFCRCPNQLSVMWLHRLWSLINHLITDEKNTNLFLKWFRNFYLIPAHITKCGTLLLFKIDMHLQIVHPDMWKLISETNSIDGLPLVDSDGYFPHIRSSIFGEAKPKKLSDCLVFWNRLDYLNWPIEVQMFYDLLTYFAKFPLASHTLNNLRNLPIFETFHGEFVSLGNQTAFTLDGQENLPENGQNIWMSKALFLKKHYNFLSLYKCLGIGHISSAELYADFIIPSFPEMTTDAQVVHLRYLNDRYHWDSFKAALLILKKTQFIQTSNENLNSVDQFYDHTIPFFTEMCSHEDFLPQYFFEALKTDDPPEWLQGFLRRLGLKYIPSPEEHVQFALHLSKLSLGTNLEKIKRISKLLLDSASSLSSSLPKLESAQNKKWHKSIAKMSNIPFIPSMILNKNLQILYPSTIEFPLGSIQLLKANGSCSSACQTLVWTITRVLPDWVPSILYEKMGILTLKNRSCLEQSIQHFEKLLDHLFLAKLKQQRDVGLNSLTSRATLKDILNNFYIFLKSLQDKGSIDDNDRIKLMKLPLIIVEDGRHLANPEMVVERLPVAYIKDRDYYAPFLYELPPDLHEYKALFQSLGLQQQPNFWHYAEYLRKAYSHFNVSSKDESNWDPNVYQSIMFVQQALVLSADKGVNWDNIHTLYLLSSDGKLYKSCELVFQDSSVAMQKHLPNNTKSLKFWKCSENTDTKFLEKMVLFVKLLPDRLKLKLSSEALSRCLSDKSEYCQYNQPCPAVDSLKTLFSSVEFSKCIQRLYYDQNSVIHLPNNRKWEEIDEQLKNIQIHCFSNLLIDLKDLENSETIADSDREYKCFLDGKNLLISHEDASRVNTLFPYLLADCLPELLSIELSEMKLSALLICSDPNELESNLDQLHVPELPRNFIRSHLPVLGSPVPVERIDFLEIHPLNYFRNGEYVAFLKSDAEADADPMHNFIWAKIKCCIDEDSASALCRHYEIDIGDSSGLIIVSALDLHKFIPQFKSLELGPLVPTDIEPESQSNTQSQKSKSFNRDLTEEEACKEVTRILEEAVNLPPNEYQKAIRRLYLTWHPDKNTEDKKDLATVVFQHLLNEIHRLERGGTSSSDSSQAFHAHAWEKFRSNTNQRWNDFSHGRSRNTFNDFGFTSHTPYESPNRNMADKYWRTANDDLKAAFYARRCQNSEIGREFGNEHVIILAQQAVEKALKAALFAEIGTAEKHHKLNYFAQRVAERTNCSKDIVHKVSNFVSECGVDLTHLRYPEGHSSRPHLTYTESQAVKAVDYATEIVDDLRKAFPAFKL